MVQDCQIEDVLNLLLMMNLIVVVVVDQNDDDNPNEIVIFLLIYPKKIQDKKIKFMNIE
jgi:hypothetical protein